MNTKPSKATTAAATGIVVLSVGVAQYLKSDQRWLPVAAFVVAAVLLLQALFFWWKDQTKHRRNTKA